MLRILAPRTTARACTITSVITATSATPLTTAKATSLTGSSAGLLATSKTTVTTKIRAAGFVLAFVGGGAAYQRHVGEHHGPEDGEHTLSGGFEEAAARLEFVLFLFHNFNIPYRLAGFGLG